MNKPSKSEASSLKPKLIASPQNQFVKELLLLKEKSKTRKQSGLFLVEGVREIGLALKGGYQPKQVLVCEDILTNTGFIEDILQKTSAEYITVSKQVYQKLAYRQTTEGVIAVVKSKDLSLQSLKISNTNPLLLVAESPEKPGNIGALLRTADAAKVDAVLIANPKTDLYNPNIIRASVGCLFTTSIATASTHEIIDYLQQHQISIVAAALNSKALPYHQQNYTKATAIVVGTEDTGLSNIWLEKSDKTICIPMQGVIDSMNVSVAAAVLIFEAKRQRGF